MKCMKQRFNQSLKLFYSFQIKLKNWMKKLINLNKLSNMYFKNIFWNIIFLSSLFILIIIINNRMLN